MAGSWYDMTDCEAVKVWSKALTTAVNQRDPFFNRAVGSWHGVLIMETSYIPESVSSELGPDWADQQNAMVNVIEEMRGE